MNPRALVAAGILVAWLGGVGMLVRREFFRPDIDRLAEAALRVTPDAVFYAVMQGDRQVGFASSTIDTAMTEIEQRDYLVADLLVNGQVHRAEVRTNVIVSRTLRLRSFELAYDPDRTPVKVTGQVDGDSLLVLTVARGEGAAPDTQRVPLAGPMLLPSLVPLAVALQDRPRVGRSITFPVFDQGALRPRNVRLDVRAESLFVVNDSSVFDSTAGRWVATLPDTVRGWQVVSQSGGGVDGWVDEQGRLIRSSQLGLDLVRRPYEVAFENWQLGDTARSAAVPVRAAATDRVVGATVIAAGVRVPATPLAELRATVLGPIAGLDLEGGRQHRVGDTVIVTRESPFTLAPRYITIRNAAERAAQPALRGEPLLEVEHPDIRETADRIADGGRDPRRVATRLARWVHDSVARVAGSGPAGALRVLRERRGDAADHAQLFVALARAAGVPARVVSGVLLVNGTFYHHTWAEVTLRDWVAVDPALGQFPADAAHLRLQVHEGTRPADLDRLLSGLRLDVLSTR